MTEHRLKTWPVSWEHIRDGMKRFEFRKNDRNFQVGDIVVLREWDPFREVFTGRSMKMKITYILHGGQFEIPEGYCIFSIKDYKGG
jgi:FtsP/CotA-like multicopper oxidase with cupredoxin domain